MEDVKDSRPFYPFVLLDTALPLLTFRHDSLNLALSYVQKFLATRDELDWISVRIPASHYLRFLLAMGSPHSTPIRTLAFSCWCLGKNEDTPFYCEHRHMILVVPKEFQFFKSSLSSLVPSACSIQTPLNLVYWLGNVSQRRSRCHLRKEKGKSKEEYFFIYKTLPSHYDKILVTQWEGGLYELLQPQFKSSDLKRVLAKPVLQVDSLWKQKIGDFYDLPRGIVFPVAKHFAPTPEPTPYFLYLLEGRKLYFQPDPAHELLSEEAWLQKQIQGGNVFYDNVADAMWTLRRNHQPFLKCVLKKLHYTSPNEIDPNHLYDPCHHPKRKGQFDCKPCKRCKRIQVVQREFLKKRTLKNKHRHCPHAKKMKM